MRLPPGFNPRTLTLARQWRQQAGSDDAAVVQRMLAWIRTEFAYTLDTPLPGHDSVDEFLFQQKAGFCEHFSSAFVVAMRAAGIPARVVTGYAGGVRNPLGGYWIVRRMDAHAHAWAEVWLAGRGWVRVDPTAAVAPERIYDTLEDRLGQGQGAGDAATEWRVGDVGDWLRREWNELVLSFDAQRQQAVAPVRHRPARTGPADHVVRRLRARRARLDRLAAGARRTRARPAAACLAPA
ncbi:MAG: transglutaminase-like domain-containing protein [Pseudomonas sp.]